MISEKILNYKGISFSISITLVLISIVLIMAKGISKSVEFVGGTLIEIKTSKTLDFDVFNSHLSPKIKEIDSKLTFTTQAAGENLVSIRFSLAESIDKLEKIKEAISFVCDDEEMTFERIDDIGPQVSGELARQSVIAILFAFLAITLYMAFRFNKYFAISGVLVLLQDVIISFGFVSATGIEFDLTLMAAFLTIIGYCINDTVVIYDRIRHNLIHNPTKSVANNVEMGIGQTIKRSFITSFVTLLAVFGILFFSASSIRNFGFVVGFGIIIGTFGSIFVASVLPLQLGLKPYKSKATVVRDPLFYAS